VKRLLFSGLALGALSIFVSISPAIAEVDDGSKVTIFSPKSGDKVDETVALTYELVKGSKAEHAHVYLHGQPPWLRSSNVG